MKTGTYFEYISNLGVLRAVHTKNNNYNNNSPFILSVKLISHNYLLSDLLAQCPGEGGEYENRGEPAGEGAD